MYGFIWVKKWLKFTQFFHNTHFHELLKDLPLHVKETARCVCVWGIPVHCSPGYHLPFCHFPQELNELKDQIQDVEGKYMQGLKEMKVPVPEVWVCNTNPT